MGTRQKWEYIAEFVRAHIDDEGAKEHLKERWPNYRPPKYTPNLTQRWLDMRGNEGWELVHMEPVLGVIGANEDFRPIAGHVTTDWSNAYFCVFKRPIE